MVHLLIYGLLICFCMATNRPYKKIIPNGDPNAKCLDGTAPALYIDWGANRQNYLIFLMGGGYCAGLEISGTLQTCYQRTKTMFGSSDLLPQEFLFEGYLSTDPQTNPEFANWTKVVINYCDGAMHQGYSKDPIQYKDTRLYFRGATNFRSHIQWLIKEHSLASAERVMLTGVSAGGIATFLWGEYLKSLLEKPNGLFMVIDSGIFLNQQSVRTGMLKLGVSFANLYKVANADESTPLKQCNKFYPAEEYKCWFAQYAYPFTIGPRLWIQSQYDTWSIPNILDVFCLTPTDTGSTLSACNVTQMQDIEGYRQKLMSVMKQFSLSYEDAFWSISCANHGYALQDKFYDSPKQVVPKESSVTVRQAVIISFLYEDKFYNVDRMEWPNNAACAY